MYEFYFYFEDINILDGTINCNETWIHSSMVHVHVYTADNINNKGHTPFLIVKLRLD